MAVGSPVTFPLLLRSRSPWLLATLSAMSPTASRAQVQLTVAPTVGYLWSGPLVAAQGVSWTLGSRGGIGIRGVLALRSAWEVSAFVGHASDRSAQIGNVRDKVATAVGSVTIGRALAHFRGIQLSPRLGLGLLNHRFSQLSGGPTPSYSDLSLGPMFGAEARLRVAHRVTLRLSLDDYVTRYSSEALEPGNVPKRWSHSGLVAVGLGIALTSPR
jgi:hypothetical protein